ncbi:MAG: hypothetical protein EON60_05765 [Alphaproteobacteria bacterium]|nr:MAG: hypothetical protein EON60_05765 [Alphaproteobacteria bacterium]
MGKIEKMILLLVAFMLFGNSMALTQQWAVTGSIMTLFTLLALLAAIGFYATTGQDNLPDLRRVLKNRRQ